MIDGEGSLHPFVGLCGVVYLEGNEANAKHLLRSKRSKREAPASKQTKQARSTCFELARPQARERDPVRITSGKTSAPSESSLEGPMGDGEPPEPVLKPDEGASVSSPPIPLWSKP
jgi:hypothetical protein